MYSVVVEVSHKCYQFNTYFFAIVPMPSKSRHPKVLKWVHNRLCLSNLNLLYDGRGPYWLKLLLFHRSVTYNPRMSNVDSGPSIQTKV